MTVTLFIILAIAAVVTTVPVVLLIPRVRTSPAFDRLLWAATPVSGFLVGWVAVAMYRDSPVLGAWIIMDTPVLAAVGGALGGALAVNLPLWVLDRFDMDEEAKLFEDEALPDEDEALPDEDEALPDEDEALPDEDEALPDEDGGALVPDADEGELSSGEDEGASSTEEGTEDLSAEEGTETERKP